MSVLNPVWEQQKPIQSEAQQMAATVALDALDTSSDPIVKVLQRIRETHIHGGAFTALFKVGANHVFDWFASRNRLLEFDILPLLLRRQEIRDALPDLGIPTDFLSTSPDQACGTGGIDTVDGFPFDDPFRFEGQLGRTLFAGGAYGSKNIMSGREAMNLAYEYSDATFGRRYEDVSLFTCYKPWTPWFAGIAWDWTSVLFDRRERTLRFLAVTDTD